MRRSLRLGLAGLAALVVLAGCGEDDEPAATEQAVEISDFEFAPEVITVEAGALVTWSNSDRAAHTASGADGSFDTGPLGKDEDAEVTFDEPGSFEYICEFHPFMKGTVEVE